MSRANRPVVVALDGPSGVGKSSTARRVAKALGLPYLDTGAMYRAIGLRVLEAGIDASDAEAVARVLEEIELDTRYDGERFEVLLDEEPVGHRIRTPEVGVVTSKIATHAAVRRLLVELQRRCGREHGGVLEGRDIGSVVFPETPFKFYLDAPEEVRVRRRYAQLRESGREVSEDEVSAELESRDRRDRQRRDSPLRVDGSYVVIDTGTMGIDEVVEQIVSSVRARTADRRS